MTEKIIIHIDGVQGSGKSFICSKIKNILCVDTDDIMKKSIKIIEEFSLNCCETCLCKNAVNRL